MHVTTSQRRDIRNAFMPIKISSFCLFFSPSYMEIPTEAINTDIALDWNHLRLKMDHENNS